MDLDCLSVMDLGRMSLCSGMERKDYWRHRLETQYMENSELVKRAFKYASADNLHINEYLLLQNSIDCLRGSNFRLGGNILDPRLDSKYRPSSNEMAILNRTLLLSSAIAILSTSPALAHPS